MRLVLLSSLFVLALAAPAEAQAPRESGLDAVSAIVELTDEQRVEYARLGRAGDAATVCYVVSLVAAVLGVSGIVGGLEILYSGPGLGFLIAGSALSVGSVVVLGVAITFDVRAAENRTRWLRETGLAFGIAPNGGGATLTVSGRF